MTDEGAPQTNPNLTDDEILKRADMIAEARKLEQEEKQRQIEEEKARKAAEAERIKKEQEAEAAAKLAEANRIKEEENAKKAAELKRAHELVNAEKAAQPKKKHIGAKIVLAIVILLIIVAGIAVATYQVSSNQVADGTPLQYQSHYTVWLPQGTTYIAGVPITIVAKPEGMMAKIGDDSAKTLKQGETFTTNPYKVTISLFKGAWKVFEITGKVQMTYKGIPPEENLVKFDAIISTDKQIPEFLLNIFMSIKGIKYENA